MAERDAKSELKSRNAGPKHGRLSTPSAHFNFLLTVDALSITIMRHPSSVYLSAILADCYQLYSCRPRAFLSAPKLVYSPPTAQPRYPDPGLNLCVFEPSAFISERMRTLKTMLDEGARTILVSLLPCCLAVCMVSVAWTPLTSGYLLVSDTHSKCALPIVEVSYPLSSPLHPQGFIHLVRIICECFMYMCKLLGSWTWSTRSRCVDR